MLRTFMALIALFIAFSGSVSEAGGHFVGNGGEGVWIGETLLLRDLYEADLSKPSIAFGQSAALKKAVAKIAFVPALQVPRDLLTRKLTEIENANPGFGFFLSETMGSQDWDTTTATLHSVDESETPALPLGATRVTIANRSLGLITVQLDLWKKLAPSHQVALLIHEAFYSLLRSQCENGVRCAQSAATTRQLTAQAFDRSSKLNRTLLEQIFVPLEIENEFPFFSGIKISGNSSGATASPLEILDSASDRDVILSAVQLICRSGATGALELSRAPYVLILRVYNTAHFHQTAVEIHARRPSREIYSLPPAGSAADCVKTLTLKLQSWFSKGAGAKPEREKPAAQTDHYDDETQYAEDAQDGA